MLKGVGAVGWYKDGGMWLAGVPPTRSVAVVGVVWGMLRGALNIVRKGWCTSTLKMSSASLSAVLRLVGAPSRAMGELAVSQIPIRDRLLGVFECSGSCCPPKEGLRPWWFGATRAGCTTVIALAFSLVRPAESVEPDFVVTLVGPIVERTAAVSFALTSARRGWHLLSTRMDSSP